MPEVTLTSPQEATVALRDKAYARLYDLGRLQADRNRAGKLSLMIDAANARTLHLVSKAIDLDEAASALLPAPASLPTRPFKEGELVCRRGEPGIIHKVTRVGACTLTLTDGSSSHTEDFVHWTAQPQTQEPLALVAPLTLAPLTQDQSAYLAAMAMPTAASDLLTVVGGPRHPLPFPGYHPGDQVVARSDITGMIRSVVSATLTDVWTKRHGCPAEWFPSEELEMYRPVIAPALQEAAAEEDANAALAGIVHIHLPAQPIRMTTETVNGVSRMLLVCGEDATEANCADTSAEIGKLTQALDRILADAKTLGVAKAIANEALREHGYGPANDEPDDLPPALYVPEVRIPEAAFLACRKAMQEMSQDPAEPRRPHVLHRLRTAGLAMDKAWISLQPEYGPGLNSPEGPVVARPAPVMVEEGEQYA